MADVLAVRDEYRAQQWAMVVQECRSSGMTNREYCRQRGISEKSFYYWQRKFRTQIVASAAPQLVQLEAVPVTEEALQIQYRGAKLRLPAGQPPSASWRAAQKPRPLPSRGTPFCSPGRGSP